MRLVHKADKISCTPISKRTNEGSEGKKEGRRTNERETTTTDGGFVIQNVISPQPPQSLSSPPPILIFRRQPVTVSGHGWFDSLSARWGSHASVRPRWDFFLLELGRVQLSRSVCRNVASMAMMLRTVVIRIWPLFYDGSALNRARLLLPCPQVVVILGGVEMGLCFELN